MSEEFLKGELIRQLRIAKGYTQKQLAELLHISEKTVSKWETEKGLPDISLLSPLAKALQVSTEELLSNHPVENRNKSANLYQTCFYVCPVCGNIIQSVGEAMVFCCGERLQALPCNPQNESHQIVAERIENMYYLHMDHEMSKEHYISFYAYVTADRVQLLKLYPEQNAEARFFITGHGFLYAYCQKHGLYKQRV